MKTESAPHPHAPTDAAFGRPAAGGSGDVNLRDRTKLGRWLIAGVSLAVMLLLSGCAITPGSDWRIEPVIRDQSGPHFLENHHVDRDDVTFATQLVKSDTAGGLWVTSGTTWLHINTAGDKPTPFNESRTAASFVAENPTSLIVAVNSLEGGLNGLYRFNTHSKKWTSLISTTDWLGDVTRTSNGTVLSVAYAKGAPYPEYPQPFLIRTLAPNGHQDILIPAAEPAAAVAITVGKNDAVSVATDTGGFTRETNGRTVNLPTPSRTPVAGVNPVIAANPEGDLILSIAHPARSATPSAIIGGSDDARSILAFPSTDNAVSALSITHHGTTTLLPFTRGAVAAAWLNKTTLVFVIGGSGDASVIAKTTIPET